MAHLDLQDALGRLDVILLRRRHHERYLRRLGPTCAPQFTGLISHAFSHLHRFMAAYKTFSHISTSLAIFVNGTNIKASEVHLDSILHRLQIK